MMKNQSVMKPIISLVLFTVFVPSTATGQTGAKTPPEKPAITAPASAPVSTAPAAATPAASATSSPTTSASNDVSMELQPYRIVVKFSLADGVAMDQAVGLRILNDFLALSTRIVGQPWQMRTEWAEGQIWDANFDIWTEWPEQYAYDRKTVFETDKIWLVRAQPGADQNALELVGREFDLKTGDLGPKRTRTASISDLPRNILELGRQIFRPISEVAGNEGGKVRLRVQGSALSATTPEGSILQTGQYFRLVRLFFDRSGKFASRTIEPWTYLKSETVSESGITCQIISSFRDPIGRKYRQYNRLYALALKPAELPTELQFSQLINTNGTSIRHPIAGYKVEIHSWPDGPVQAGQLTDRDGKVKIEPLPGLDFYGVRLLGGAVEPLLDVPILSGDQVPPILADTKPAAVEFEQTLIAFRDDILDAIAQRLVYEARLGDRTKAEDWDSVAQLIRLWQATPSPTVFSTKLADWKVSAQKRQLAEKKAIFTQAAQALVAELEALASRYETQEIDAFEDSLQKKSSSPYLQDLSEKQQEKAKAQTK